MTIHFNKDVPVGNANNRKQVTTSVECAPEINIGKIMTEKFKSYTEGKTSQETKYDPYYGSYTNVTDISDVDGNLNKNVSYEQILNNDGTLKSGWIVDKYGVPHYSGLSYVNENPNGPNQVNFDDNKLDDFFKKFFGGVPKDITFDSEKNLEGSYDRPIATHAPNEGTLKYEIRDGKFVMKNA